jgi:hypothetical protein
MWVGDNSSRVPGRTTTVSGVRESGWGGGTQHTGQWQSITTSTRPGQDLRRIGNSVPHTHPTHGKKHTRRIKTEKQPGTNLPACFDVNPKSSHLAYLP